MLLFNGQTSDKIKKHGDIELLSHIFAVVDISDEHYTNISNQNHVISLPCHYHSILKQGKLAVFMLQY